jgi:radical SAM superfamily enzyme YgiQ (UPF0313 family)
MYTEENGTTNRTNQPLFPYSLAVCAAAVRTAFPDASVAAFDGCLSDKEEASRVLNRLITTYQPDYVIMPINLLALEPALAPLAGLKEKQPFFLIGLASQPFVAEAMREYPCLDTVIEHEWSGTVCRLLSDRSSPREPHTVSPGIYYRSGTDILQSEAAEHTPLALLPLPAFDLFPPHAYAAYVTLWSAGCNHHCSFCHFSLYPGSGWESRPVDDILRELQQVAELSGKKTLLVRVMDNEFTLQPAFARALAERLIAARLPLIFDTNIRVSTVDRELVSLLARAGFTQLGFGIESGDQQVLDANNKEITLKHIRATATALRQAHVYATGYILFGMIGESRATVAETMDFVFNRLRLYSVNGGIALPYAGTPFAAYLQKQGWLSAFTLRNLRWVYRHVYHWNEVTGPAVKPAWRVGELQFDDLCELYRSAEHKLGRGSRFFYYYFRFRRDPRAAVRACLRMLVHPRRWSGVFSCRS